MADITQDNIKIDSDSNSLFIDSVKIFLKYKILIILTCLAIGLITAILVFFVMDPIFQSNSTIKATSKSLGLGSLISGGVTDFSEIGDIGGGSTSKELALYENILLSRRCIEETIIRFNLLEEWGLKFMQEAVMIFRVNVMEIKKDKLAGMIILGVYDKNKERAREMCEFLIFQLNKINTELNIQNARNNREFVEARYNLVREDLRKAEDSLRQYQDIYGIAPDVVVRAAAQSEIQLEGEIKSEEVRLELLRKILSPDQAEIKAQEDKISALKDQLFEMNNSTDRSGNLTLKGAPGMVMNYIRLQRNVEIQNKILTFVVPVFEQAKIEEKKETPSLLVLDPPNIPEIKSKPKRLTTIFISLVATFIILMLILILYETYYKKLKYMLRR